MQDPPVPSFDDPALKAALRRALDSEIAPTGLRNQIHALATDQAERPALSYTATGAQPTRAPAAEAADQPIPLFRRPLYRFAAAAILIVGLGSLAFEVWNTSPPPATSAYVFSPSLFKGMIAAHSARATATEQSPDMVKSLADAARLSATINRPVFV